MRGAREQVGSAEHLATSSCTPLAQEALDVAGVAKGGCGQYVGVVLAISITLISVYLNDNAFVEAILYEKKNGYFSLKYFLKKECFFTLT